ncbi:ABC transporter G family member 12 [Tetrabaena socialis]|uniref:ABC transporter G family member 12 n=1 Tax=Tetrabaena socialis TaxID=47790 RepID=A0A2J8ADU9_9CHLO|nr:ABC transporter G family member 12 [Tetrabaena socialis]|eukprot:PNH10695.1 ABC transporter G family member 12 [Tetrabaena socialis]
MSTPPVAKDGDSYVLNVVAPAPKESRYAAAQLATLTWDKLNVKTKDVKGGDRHILRDVLGYVAPKDMLAIMGPSGCGKSTLLDALAGRLPRSVSVKGTVLLNGFKSRLTYGLSAYVTQDEILVGTLSVRETLLYAALLRLPSNMSYATKAGRVEEVITELGLEEAQHTKIGTPFIKGISGGQKRRVSIGESRGQGSGRVGKACVLVQVQVGYAFAGFMHNEFDGTEGWLCPCYAQASGCGSEYANTTCTLRGEDILTYWTVGGLNKWVDVGIQFGMAAVYRILFWLVFELFDKLCLLSAGEVVYFGRASGALTMFEEAGLPCPAMRNPTDHFLRAINRDFKGEEGFDPEANIRTLCDIFAAKLKPGIEKCVQELSQPGDEYGCSTCGANPLYQVLVLTRRMFINNWRNIAVFWLRLGMYIMLCICIGTIYFKLDDSWQGTYSRTAMMFFVVAFLTFMSIAGFPAFVEDMGVRAWKGGG